MKHSRIWGPVKREELHRLAKIAAEAVGYEEGFGVEGCDLRESGWWLVYTRQSREEQAQNNRLPDYLRTCAQASAAASAWSGWARSKNECGAAS